MDNKSIVETNPVEGEVLQAKVISPSEEMPKKRPFYKKPKFIGSVIALLLLIGGVIWAVNAFGVYRNAKKYKVAYDIVQQQTKYCDDIATTKAEKKYFDYCDEFRSRFNPVEREAK